jgi:hypothetical protein
MAHQSDEQSSHRKLLIWGFSSVGRAPALHAGGQEFESLNLHHTSGNNSLGDTPVPIPNTQVKPENADGTYKETCWKSRKPPDQKDFSF